jgi:FKBP-type peptidyl-prolyl cis-trans isomerase
MAGGEDVKDVRFFPILHIYATGFLILRFPKPIDMTRKILLPVWICLISSCTSEIWYRTPSGLQYHVFPSSSNSKNILSSTGCTVKVDMTEKIKDSVTGSTEGFMPVYRAIIPVPGGVSGYDAMETFFYGMKEGDSIVVVQRMDSLVKKGFLSAIPAGMKGGDERVTYMKVLKIFSGLNADSLINADKIEEQKRIDLVQEVKGKERVEAFIRQNKINAAPLDSGVYIETLQKGNGPLIRVGDSVCLQYRMKSLHGHVLDTNMDTSFRHQDTLRYVAGRGYLLRSVDRALTKLQKGSRVNIYLPTMKAMGSQPPPGPGAPPYVDIIMEINVIDLFNTTGRRF